MFGKEDLAALESELRKAVVAKLGEENIQSPVKPTENFYRTADGWHFVYNEYEIACYALGTIEVVKRMAPGDFRTVRQEQFYLGEDVSNADRIAALKEECALQKDGEHSARIGF